MVIHILVPFRIQPPPPPPPCLASVLFMPTTSLPAECSLMARAPTRRPETSPGKKRSFCRAVPCRVSWLTHSCEWAAYDRPMLADARDSSSITTQCAW